MVPQWQQFWEVVMINNFVDIFLYYMQTGGEVMLPLLLFCLWMWMLILFYLPCWQPPLQDEIKTLIQVFGEKRCPSKRHNRQLYDYLLRDCERRMQQGIPTIKVFATIAPLLGLLGTVAGMIKTFQSVAMFGLANPKALAGGISEAMVTTQFGLLIAVPGILAVYFLRRKVVRNMARLEQMTVQLIADNKRSDDASATFVL